MAAQLKTFADGDVLTASQMNTYLMNQAVIVCDSSADYPSAPVNGMVIYDKALDCYLTRGASSWIRTIPQTGSAVQTYSPAVSQSSAVPATINDGDYVRSGAFVDVFVNLAITGSGAGGTAVTVTLPVTARAMTANSVIGAGFIFDNTNKDQWAVAVVMSGTGSVQFVGYNLSTTSTGSWGAVPANGLQSGDVLRFNARYLAA